MLARQAPGPKISQMAILVVLIIVLGVRKVQTCLPKSRLQGSAPKRQSTLPNLMWNDREAAACKLNLWWAHPEAWRCRLTCDQTHLLRRIRSRHTHSHFKALSPAALPYLVPRLRAVRHRADDRGTSTGTLL